MPNKKIKQQSGRVAIVIMAAGKGTRLKSKHPKVLHEVGGKPLLAHVIRTASQLVPANDIYTIIGHEAERVRGAVADTGVQFVVQNPQRGTGHALMAARQAIASYDHVIVLSGDAPMITPQTITELRDFHEHSGAAMTILSAVLPDPTGYGRIIRKSSRNAIVQSIVEQKSATPKQQQIREVNSGFYAFAVKPLLTYIGKLSTENPHSEFYLTDMAAVLAKAKQRVMVVEAPDPHEVLGGNTRSELAAIDQRLRLSKCEQLMAEGVTILFPQTCVIDNDVQIAPDTVIEPFVQLLGRTRIASDCRIQSYSVISDSELADGVKVQPGCVIENSRILSNAVLGPYSHLRPGNEVCEGAHIGNFVELKKTRVGKGSKANHLTYLGDAEIGERVNVGAGTITCNYDGVNKYKTVIEDGVFVGSDSSFVAPVRIGKNAYIAAASCITDDVPEDSLALARARQVNKVGWSKKKREAVQAAKPRA